MDEERIRQARRKWQYCGQQRPPFAEVPAPGQESVWDYPRPPALRADRREVVVYAGEFELARSRQSYRVLETASPPTFYLPPETVAWEHLLAVAGASFCEWKGRAQYFDVLVGEQRWSRAAWCYPQPLQGFETIAGHPAFYPGSLTCYVGGERVRPQPGGYYGGWLTSELTGPFKGVPGTEQW